MSTLTHASAPPSKKFETLSGGSGLRPTPALPLGPFYPLDMPADETSSLWHEGLPPQGTRALRLQGLVQTPDRRGLAGVLVEIWHADPAGRYRHPSAPDAHRVLAGFTGQGRVFSDAAGRFEFTSLVPGGYDGAQARRAPHVHVQITGQFDRLVTQLFVPGCADNAADRWFRMLADPQTVTPEVVSDDAMGLTPALDCRPHPRLMPRLARFARRTSTQGATR